MSDLSYLWPGKQASLQHQHQHNTSIHNHQNELEEAEDENADEIPSVVKTEKYSFSSRNKHQRVKEPLESEKEKDYEEPATEKEKGDIVEHKNDEDNSKDSKIFSSSKVRLLFYLYIYTLLSNFLYPNILDFIVYTQINL